MADYYAQQKKQAQAVAKGQGQHVDAAYSGVNYAPQVGGGNLNLGAFQGLLGSPNPAEAGAAQGLFGALQTGGQGVLDAYGQASGMYDSGFRSSADAQRMAFQRGIGDNLTQQLLGIEQQRHAEQLASQQAQVGQQEQAFQMAMGLAQQGLTPEQIGPIIQAYNQIGQQGYQGGDPSQWLQGLSALNGLGDQGIDPATLAQLGEKVSAAVNNAYAMGASSYQDVLNAAKTALAQSNAYNASKYAPQIEDMIAQAYRATNATLGPGGTRPVAPDPSLGIGAFDMNQRPGQGTAFAAGSSGGGSLGSAAGDALKYGALGGLVGTALGPPGTVVGGGLGSLYGLIHGLF